MPDQRAPMAFATVGLLLFATTVMAQTRLQSHRDLDWEAPRRWVHVDNVVPQKAALFERARLEWLSVLQTGDSLLGDGRPLFWYANGNRLHTYFTFYPFRTWPDLDARAKMVEATNNVVGKDALERYNTGDSGLVSPHYSQIWRRSNDDDIVWSGTDQLSELTAAVGRLDVHMPNLQQSDTIDSLWKEIKTALVAQKYPLACRAYDSIYGKGQNMMLWLAPDSTAYRKAPSIESALKQQFGLQKGGAIFTKFREVFPIEESYEIRRRADLSNLGS